MAPAKNPMRRSWLDDTDGGWVAHRLKLMVSPSWRHRPIPLYHLLTRIEIEHMRHGGVENGNLTVAYDQFVDAGMSRRTIRPSILLAVDLGLIELRQSGAWAGDIRTPNLYRLTYLPEKGRRAPTDEWAQITEELALAAVEKYQAAVSLKKPTSQCHNLQPTSAITCKQTGSASATSRNSPVPEMEHTLISGGNPAATTEAVQHAEEAPPHKGRDRRSVQAVEPIDDISARSTEPIPVTGSLIASLNKNRRFGEKAIEVRSSAGENVQHATQIPQRADLVRADLTENSYSEPRTLLRPQIEGVSVNMGISHNAIGDDERALLRWLQGFTGTATHRTAQQNLSGQLKGDAIAEAANFLVGMGLLQIEQAGRSRVYTLLDAGRDVSLLSDPDQFDLVNWLEGAPQ